MDPELVTEVEKDIAKDMLQEPANVKREHLFGDWAAQSLKEKI